MILFNPATLIIFIYYFFLSFLTGQFQRWQETGRGMVTWAGAQDGAAAGTRPSTYWANQRRHPATFIHHEHYFIWSYVGEQFSVT